MLNTIFKNLWTCLAVESFAGGLKSANYEILNLSLDDTAQFKNLDSLIISLAERFHSIKFKFQRPDEYRLKLELRKNELSERIEMLEYDSVYFLLPFNEISDYIKPKQHNWLEVFYHKIPKRFYI